MKFEMTVDPPLRIGMLTPSSNTVVEPVVADMLASLPEVTAHAARLRVTEISLTNKSQSQFAMETMLAAGDLLADAQVSTGVKGGAVSLVKKQKDTAQKSFCFSD